MRCFFSYFVSQVFYINYIRIYLLGLCFRHLIGYIQYEKLIEICAKYGFTPKIVHESNNISSIIQLVKNGLGISIVPTNIVKSHNYPELGFLELKKVNLFTDILLAKEDHLCGIS